MKKIKVICPHCGQTMYYNNWFDWVLSNPFHWFGKRKAKCKKCGKVSYMRRKR